MMINADEEYNIPSSLSYVQELIANINMCHSFSKL